ncbi:FecR family protein [Rhodohalobacter halophilus]|uniref:FecR family protein n=1 Tax=Rhodohalobacter halophilus TaxID=1812810 RepID=UPI00083FB9DE|nr:FecR family protein [Rhodohalobacter halophilus]
MKKTIISLFVIGAVITGIILMMSDRSDSVYEEPVLNETDDEIAFVRRYVPDVTVTNASYRDSLQEVGRGLVSGDTLTTNNSGYAMVLFLDESIARVSPQSQMVIRSELNPERNLNMRTHVGMLLGGMFLDVESRPDREFEITTTRAVASVKGTRFGVTADDKIWVEEGEVEVTLRETGEVRSLTNRMFIQVQDDGSVDSGELSDEELMELAEEFQILESDLIERQMKIQFRNRAGDTVEEEIRVYEQTDSTVE